MAKVEVYLNVVVFSLKVPATMKGVPSPVTVIVLPSPVNIPPVGISKSLTVTFPVLSEAGL